MYTLKNLAIRAKRYDDNPAAGLAETFTEQVESYGRSFEFGLATRHNLRHRPFSLAGMAPLGLGMLSKGRMDLTPHRIQHVEQLQQILARAKQLEEAA
jgi:hypothetical protein